MTRHGFRPAGAVVPVAMVFLATARAADTSPPEDSLKESAARHLAGPVESMPCDRHRFLWGVGYIDGSYMY